MLLELDEIQLRLDQQFIPLEPMLVGFRLMPSPVSLVEITRLESKLGGRFSESFRELLLRFQFGRFTVGPIVFCNTGDYLSWLLEHNQNETLGPCPRWWALGVRPERIHLVAVSDPFTILLNNSTGTVLAFRDGEAWDDHAIEIACDFGRFLRGAGTVFLLRSPNQKNETLALQVANDVGAESEGTRFWRWLAE